MVWGYIIAAVASLAGAAYYQKKMIEDMKDSQSGVFVNKAGASEGLRLIYGRRRVGAIKVWKGVTRSGAKIVNTVGYDKLVNQTAKDNQHGGDRGSADWLHRFDVWGQGPIEEIETFHIDGDEHTNTRFTGRSHPMFRSVSYYGSSSQTAPADLVAAHNEITSDMKGNNVAYSWNRFLLRQEDIQFNGEPNVTATVKGLKVWNPATDPNDSSVKSWSNNPALCLLDYLMADYGKGLNESDIDIASFITAAATCDITETIPSQLTNTTGSALSYYYNRSTGELESVADGATLPNYRTYQTGTSQKRFQCDIILEPTDTTQKNVEKILKTMKGSLPFSQGKYKLVLEDIGTSVKSFDESNVLGGLNISYADRSKRLNRLTVKFPNRNKNFEDDVVAYPETTSLQYSNWYAEDQNEDLHNEISLDGVTDYYQALDLAEFITKESRTQMFIDFKAQPEAMVLEAGDIISLTHSTPSWTAKEFIVRELTINSDLTVNIKAQEYDSSIYQWGTKDAEPEEAWQFIDPFATPDSINNLTLTQINEEKNDDTVLTHISATWDDIVTTTNTVDRIFIGYKRSTDSVYDWTTMPAGETSFVIRALDDTTTYDVAAYYQDKVGKQSDIVSAQLGMTGQSTGVGTAVANAASALSTANTAQSTANTANTAASNAQSTADSAASSASTAVANAANALSVANSKIAATEVENAIANNVTNIDGAKITTGIVNAALIDTDTLAVKRFANVSSSIIDHNGNNVPLRTNQSAFYRKSTDFSLVESATGNFCTLTVPNVRNNATYTATFTGVLGDNTGIYVEYSLDNSTWVQAQGGLQNITMNVGTIRSYTFMYIGQITNMTTQTNVYWRVRFQTKHRSTYLSLYVDMDNTT